MHEPSRRRLLAGVGAGVAGVLAGCGAPASDDGTPTPTPSPTPTPAIPADAPDFWRWLPAPSALDVPRYGLRQLTLEPMREAGAANRRLNPKRFTLPDLDSALPETSEFLTVSDPTFGAGVLLGDFDPAAVGQALTDAGYEAGEAASTYASDRVVVEVGSERLLWADRQAGAREAADALRTMLDGDGGEPYPAADEGLRRTLSTIEPAESRFMLSYEPGSQSGLLEGARFHANGMTFTESSVEWRIAVVYDGVPPEGAAADYRAIFEEKQGFSDVLTRTEDDLLAVRVSTSPIHATTTSPL